MVEDLTDYDRAREAERAGEARYQTLVTTASVGIFHADAQGLVTYVNEKWCEIGGMTPAQAMGDGWLAGVHAEDRERIAARWAAFAKGDSTYRTECRYQRPDGAVAYCYVQALRETDRAGNLTGFIGYVTDISERRRAEEALRESEQRLREISEASSDWFWEMDENLRFSYFSDHFTEVTGVPSDMLLGKTREETGIPDVDSDEWATHLANLAAHRPFRDFHHPRTHADGRVVHLSINGKPVFDEAGSFKGYCGTGSDITERKRAEEALRLTQFAIDNASDAAFWLDRDGRLTFVNDTACRMLGYAREEFLALNIADIDPAVCPGDFTRVWERIKAHGSTTFEARHRTKDGNDIPVEVSMSYMKRGDEELACNFSRDITERKRAEEALRLTQFAIDHASDAAFWLDRDGRLTFINDTACRMLGYAREEFLALNIADIDPDVCPVDFARAWERIKARGPTTFEARHRTKGGNVIPVEVSMYYLKRGDEELACSFSRDITDRKRAEEALRESEARLSAFMENSPGAISIKGLDGRYMLINPVFENILGMTSDAVAGKLSKDVFSPAFAASGDAHDRAVIDTGEVVEREETLDVGQTARELFTVKFPLRDDDGAITAIGAIHVDITARKRAEAALQNAHDELERRVEERTRELLTANTQLVQEIAERNRAEADLGVSEARYREIFDESPAGIWEEDWSAVKRMLDRLARRGVKDWRRYFDQRPDQLEKAYDLGVPVEISWATCEIYRAPDRETLIESTRSDEVAVEELNGFRDTLLSFLAGDMAHAYEAADRAVDGSEVFIRSRAVIPPAHRADWSRVLFAIEDIGKRRRAEAALKESEAKLREILENSPIGVAVVSHDKDGTRQSGDRLFINSAFVQMFGGASREDLIEAEISDSWVDLDRLRTAEEIMTNHDELVDFEVRRRRLDGTEWWFSMNSRPIRFDDQDCTMVWHFDITERKRAEAALRESEARYREIFDESPVGIWEEDWSAVKRMVDRLAQRGVGNWRNYFKQNPRIFEEIYELIPITNASHAILDLYGAPDVAALNVMFTALAMPEDDIAVRETLIAFIEGKTGCEYDARERKFDGTEIITHNQLVIPPNHRDDWSRVIYAIEDITERKRAEEALTESEARYREIFDESPVGIWEDDWSDVKSMLDDMVAGGVTDLREYFHDNPDKLGEAYDLAKIVDISLATLELFGAPNKQAVSDWTKAASKSDEGLNGFLDNMIAFMAGEPEFYYEAPDSRLDGTPIVTSNRLTIPPQHRHDWSRVISTIENITERKRVEEALRDSEERYRELFDESPIAIWVEDWSPIKQMLDDLVRGGVKDLRGYFNSHRDSLKMAYDSAEVIDISRETVKLYGKESKEHMLRMTTAAVVIDEELDAFRDTVLSFMAGQAAVEIESKDTFGDGSEIIVRRRIVIPPKHRGDWSRVIYAIEDITERKRAEEAIRTRDAWLGGILENAPIQVVLKDTEGRIMAISQNVADFFGLEREDFIGRTTADFLPREDAEIYMAADCEVVESGKLIQREVTEEHDGAKVHYINAKFPLKDSEGKVIGICSLTSDVTEMKNVQEQLSHAQKMEAVGQLTGGIAHDFNNLLAIIMGNLELVEDEMEGNEGLRELLALAIGASDDDAVLTQRLLAFSRKQSLSPRPSDVNQLVRKTVALMRRTLDESIDLEPGLSGDLDAIFVDPGQLENALVNLVVNARDAIPRGGRITIETGQVYLDQADAAELDPDMTPGNYVTLAVGDDGGGMTPATIERAVDPFFTTKEVGEGSGLGLSMVFGFVKQSGGHIAIHSELDIGTAVTLFLPAAAGDPAVDAPESAPIPDQRGAGQTILVVEDNGQVRRLAANNLSSLGYSVHQAADGAAALEVLDRTPEIDLLFTDIGLPGSLDGMQFSLEARTRRPGLRVLFTSAYPQSALIKQGRMEDGFELVQKPYRKTDLAARMAAALSKPVNTTVPKGVI